MRDEAEVLEDLDPVASLSAPQTRAVLADVLKERIRQDNLHGFFRDYQDGTGAPGFKDDLEILRARFRKQGGKRTWQDIFGEEALEVMAESDPARIEEEAIQAAAVLVAWVEALRRRREGLAITVPLRRSWWVRLMTWFRGAR